MVWPIVAAFAAAAVFDYAQNKKATSKANAATEARYHEAREFIRKYLEHKQGNLFGAEQEALERRLRELDEGYERSESMIGDIGRAGHARAKAANEQLRGGATQDLASRGLLPSTAKVGLDRALQADLIRSQGAVDETLAGLRTQVSQARADKRSTAMRDLADFFARKRLGVEDWERARINLIASRQDLPAPSLLGSAAQAGQAASGFADLF